MLKQFHDKAYKKTSQNKEDGLIQYIVNDVGLTNNKGLEICCGSGIQCNLTNLIHTHRIDCLYFDKNTKMIDKGMNYWNKYDHSPVYIKDELTIHNLKNHIQQWGFDGPIDILSLDIDGLDYWFMKSIITYCSPRIIVLEFQDTIPIDLSIAVPYKERFSGWNKWAKGGPNYSCASIKAFIKLLSNYRFVGTEPKGFNAFFIREDIQSEIPTITDLNELWNSKTEIKQYSLLSRWNLVKHLEWNNI